MLIKKTKKFFSLLITAIIIFVSVFLIYEGLKSNNNNELLNNTNIEEMQEEENIDYAALTNLVTTEKIKANVTVTNTPYNQPFLLKYYGNTSQGSGIIIGKNKNDYYFVLTNCHVAIITKGYGYQDLKIKDYKGNT